MYREGMVCAVNGTPGKRLADAFSTRNGSSISEGLRQIVEQQAELVDDQAAEFRRFTEDASDITGDPDDDTPVPHDLVERKRSELMKNYNSLFANGQKLYRLDSAPAGVTVNVGVTGANGPVNIDSIRDNPRALASVAQRELEQQHEFVTPEMVIERVTQMQAEPVERGDIIEGEVG